MRSNISLNELLTELKKNRSISSIFNLYTTFTYAYLNSVTFGYSFAYKTDHFDMKVSEWSVIYFAIFSIL